jgi:epoxide hydrolase-like predicted phosphatase
MELEAAIFDLGGVLTTSVLASFIEFERSIGVPEGALLRTFAEGYDDTSKERDFHLLETGRITEAEYYRRLEANLCTVTGIEVRLPEDPLAIRRSLFGNIRRNQVMIDAASRIAKSYKAGLLTNNVREWGGWREYYPQDLFHTVVDSSEVGLRKPDPQIYLLTCERLGVDPKRAAFIDDIESNVKGARDVGMAGIHFTENDAVLEQLAKLFPKAFP